MQHNQPVSPFYDALTDQWDDMKRYGANARHTYRHIFSLLRGLSYQTVLDVSCGGAFLLQQIRNRKADVLLAGTEFSTHAIELCKTRIPDAEFYNLNLEQSALPRQFDLVLCIDVLEHIQDDLAALQNLRNMTGKYLLIAVPLGPIFKTERENLGHIHAYSRSEIRSKLCTAHFRVIREICWGFPFYDLSRRIAVLLKRNPAEGRYTIGKRRIFNLLYGVYFLNIFPFGERYFALCEPD